MNEQLLRMALISGRTRYSIRVVLASAGPVGALGGPFCLMEYADHRPVAYVETSTSSLFLEEPREVQTYRAILGQLARIALDEGQSREFIARLASDYDPPEEDSDELA